MSQTIYRLESDDLIDKIRQLLLNHSSVLTERSKPTVITVSWIERTAFHRIEIVPRETETLFNELNDNIKRFKL